MTEEQINQLLARILLSTKRKNRQFSVYDVAKDIEALIKAKGASDAAKLIGISSGMLNHFLAVFKLPEPALTYVKERKIDKVEFIYYLSKFEREDIITLANYTIDNGLTSQNLRVLLPLRKKYPTDNLLDLIERVIKSKNIKVSVIKFQKQDLKKTPDKFRELVVSLVGADNFIELNVETSFCELKIRKEGEKILRKMAKEKKQSLQELISEILK